MRTTSCLSTAGICLMATMMAVGQPIITRPPTNQSVSLGATATFQVAATAANPPVSFQWRHADDVLPWATNLSLTLTNVQLTDAGPYVVTVTDAGGTTESNAAMLDVDPTFTQITTGAIVTDKRHWHGQAWGDYDNDGDLDLFLLTTESTWNPIYRNDRNGMFTRIIEPSLQGLHHNANWFFAWLDYDNDGHLDLFLPDWSAFYGSNYKNLLLHSNGDGTFSPATGNPIGLEGAVSTAGGWGDYDRDGDLDLLLANGAGAGRAAANWFYQNQGDGSFLKLSDGSIQPLVGEVHPHAFPAWVDVDDDGWMDVFVSIFGFNSLFRNTGRGGFSKVTGDPLVSEQNNWSGMAWADYDNDGDLDVLLSGSGYPTSTRPLALFRNEGNGRFRKLTEAEIGPLAAEVANSYACAWGDYDNDGWLDLIIASGWYARESRRPLMYRNNGDGTFDKIVTGSPANEPGATMAINWVDYDQDGALDLFITDHDEGTTWSNRLFRNNGNPHAWLEVKCTGTSSPRFGTGAKVRVAASIGGRMQTQLRLIDAGGTPWGGQSFVAHFGLGEATNVTTLRIEWPSGIVQTFHELAVNQALDVTEPPRLLPRGDGRVAIRCWKGMAIEIQRSADLTHWMALDTVTNLTGCLEFDDPTAPQGSARFYRVQTL